jgi:hypothetical protein
MDESKPDPVAQGEARARLRRLFVRVLVVQVLALAALWALQTCYT